MEQGALSGGGGRVNARRRIRLLPRIHGDRRASVAAFIVQFIIIAIVVPAFVVPVAFEFLRDDDGRIVSPERISFITAVPEGGRRTAEPKRDGGDGRETSEQPAPAAEPALAPVPVFVAPVGVPSELPPTSNRASEPDPGVGPLVGGGGPTKGIRPSFTDPRLWRSPSDEVFSPLIPRTRADSLRAVLHATAEAFVDSLVRSAGPEGRAPGDWTFERNGKKYGIDPRYIHLGKFSIPTVALALLPMNVQANPIAMERAARLNSMRSEILDQASRMQREDEFRDAVRALRERKEKEHREAEAKKRAAELPVPARP